MAKVDPIIDWINNNPRKQAYKIHLMGGELFQDRWIEKGFLDIYDDLILYIDSNTDPDIHFNFITNLVFENRKPVLDFLNHNDLRVSISYDPAGRFSKSDLEIFTRNIIYFQDHIEMVSIVATKQNIDRIIAGDQLFEDLYTNYTCDFDHFLPSVATSRILMPSEKELFQFYKALVNKYLSLIHI